MSSNIARRPGSGPAAPAGGDNKYKTVQQNLKTLGQAMDMAVGELEALQLRMRTNGGRSEDVAVRIARAELDKKFVGMVNHVSIALGGAAVEVRKLNETAHEVSGLTDEARRTHARLYEALDDIRSSRPERTPRPGFFAH
ncbi:conjugal transfer protein TraB [Streptomyces chartreusis]|uniref:conjugal transfer protein TraB n=1 Tax=Streptomyces chartreusis TaxID=1969 RepID=UPI0016747D10|nr:conjugal transfer protein TraB [Streptomyces chartreusis]GGX58497.1 conjugal transfer protein TraB [Streptomyces chartreusis]